MIWREPATVRPSSLSGTKCWRRQAAEQQTTSQASDNLPSPTAAHTGCTLWAGTRKVRGFATGQGRGWPLSKTPLPADDSYGLRGKGCHEELRQALNIMSNCVTRSEAEEITQFRIMSNVPGHSAPTVIRETEPVRSLHLPLGGWEGLESTVS